MARPNADTPVSESARHLSGSGRRLCRPGRTHARSRRVGRPSAHHFPIAPRAGERATRRALNGRRRSNGVGGGTEVRLRLPLRRAGRSRRLDDPGRWRGARRDFQVESGADGARGDRGAGAGTRKTGSSKKNSVAGGKNILARNKILGVATEIRIAPRKTLAALSGRDVASVEMIESTVEDGLASTDLGLGADRIPGGADNTSARDAKTEARRSKTATRRSAMDCQRTKTIGAQDETATRRVEIMHRRAG